MLLKHINYYICVVYFIHASKLNIQGKTLNQNSLTTCTYNHEKQDSLSHQITTDMKKPLLLFCTALMSSMLNAQDMKMSIDFRERGVEISPTLYGLFFEEINFAGDGGLYAELIRNRSFEDSSNNDYWSKETPATATVSLSNLTTGMLNEAQKRALKVTISNASEQSPAGISNEGYWGINAVEGRTYKLSFYAKSTGDKDFKLCVGLQKKDGTSLGNSDMDISLTKDWKKFTTTITATGNDPKAKFVLLSKTSGIIYLDVVSLFPPTYKGHENGCRPELAELLADISPRFVRFPGGCFVEGYSKNVGFKWKKSIGPIEEREQQAGHWGYPNTNGLGYHEYLQLCEDIKAEPLYVVNVGIWHGGCVNYQSIDEYIQDALDAIEYANGDANTKYGAMRIANGHPEPFNLKYIEVGNENYNFNMGNNSDQSDHYPERYAQFYKAIKGKYPYMQVIGNVEAWGTDSPTWRNENPVDIVDEHYYRAPSWFASQYNKYNSYSRAGAKVYAGEYSANAGDCGNGNLKSALGEAIYMCGMENNSDIVAMSSYAPIFRNDNSWQWAVDMIHFNSSDHYCTPTYYTQKLFSNNIGNRIIKWKEEFTTDKTDGGAIGLGSWNTTVEYDDVKITDTEGNILFSDDFTNADNWTASDGTWVVTNGTYKQTAIAENCVSTISKTFSGDYNYEVKARKNGGNEGFLIMYGRKDANNYTWLNLGGWSNSKHGVERCVDGVKTTLATTGGNIQNNHWYNIRIEVRGNNATCYLDDKYLFTYTVDEKPVYSTVSLDENTGEAFIKLVNFTGNASSSKIELSGIKSVSEATATSMSSTNVLAENTMDNPENVVPKTESISVTNNTIDYVVPAYSINIIKLKLEGIEDENVKQPEALPQPEASYSFDGEGTSDDSGKYAGKMVGDASIQTIEGDNALFIGPQAGYFDMGQEIGTDLISTLSDFTITLDAYMSADNNLPSLGNFLFTSSSMNDVNTTNSNNVEYVFLSAKNLGYTINDNSFNTQQTVGHNMCLPSMRWYNITYTQKQGKGALYIDGKPVSTKSDMKSPSDFTSQLKFNYLGHSCWTQDSNVKNTYIDNVKIYSQAISEEQIPMLCEGLDKRNTDMSVYEALRAINIEDLDHITGNIILPTQSMGYSVTWTSSDNSIITSDGTVNLPQKEPFKTEVTLTATITCQGKNYTKEFKAQVYNDTALSINEIKTSGNGLKIEINDNQATIYSDKNMTTDIFDANGRIIKTIKATPSGTTIEMPKGSYIIQNKKFTIL